MPLFHSVNSIVLRNVSNTVRYYFGETPAWGDVSGTAYYTLAGALHERRAEGTVSMQSTMVSINSPRKQ